MRNIDDMRVGDFLYLLDCMQEECCEHKRCSECRYNDFCDDIDLPSIDSVSLRKTIEGYAEANGLIDHMHYVNQKWIPVNERLPEYGELVLAITNRFYDLMYLKKSGGKNYFTDADEEWLFRVDQILAWMPLPEPYKGEG